MVVRERLPFGRRFLCGKKASDVHVVSEITVIATCAQVARAVVLVIARTRELIRAKQKAASNLKSRQP